MNQKKTFQINRQNTQTQRTNRSIMKTFQSSLKSIDPHHAYYRARTDLDDYIVTSQSYPFGPLSPDHKKRIDSLSETSLPFINVVQDNEPEYIKSILKSPGDTKGRVISEKKVQFTSTPEIELYSVYSPTPIPAPSTQKSSTSTHNNNNNVTSNKEYRLRLSSMDNVEM